MRCISPILSPDSDKMSRSLFSAIVKKQFHTEKSKNSLTNLTHAIVVRRRSVQMEKTPKRVVPKSNVTFNVNRRRRKKLNIFQLYKTYIPNIVNAHFFTCITNTVIEIYDLQEASGCTV